MACCVYSCHKLAKAVKTLCKQHHMSVGAQRGPATLYFIKWNWILCSRARLRSWQAGRQAGTLTDALIKLNCIKLAQTHIRLHTPCTPLSQQCLSVCLTGHMCAFCLSLCTTYGALCFSFPPSFFPPASCLCQSSRFICMCVQIRVMSVARQIAWN